MRYDKLFGVKKIHSFIFGLNNYCNLHCEYCSGMFNLSMNPNSPYPDRQRKWEIPIGDVELFCDRFRGIGESNNHRLTGGEPTALPAEKFEEIVEIFTSNDRRVTLITNGYDLMGISKGCLNKIGTIFLNDHGINHDHIESCIRYLKPFYKGAIKREVNTYHYNLWEAMKHPVNKNKKCGMWMRLPTLLQGVIYPCCNMPLIGRVDRNPRIREEFIKAGWVLTNPKVVRVLRNWRKTVPRYAVDQCLNNCWQPKPQVGGRFDITSKPNDVIKRER